MAQQGGSKSGSRRGWPQSDERVRSHRSLVRGQDEGRKLFLNKHKQRVVCLRMKELLQINEREQAAVSPNRHNTLSFYFMTEQAPLLCRCRWTETKNKKEENKGVHSVRASSGASLLTMADESELSWKSALQRPEVPRGRCSKSRGDKFRTPSTIAISWQGSGGSLSPLTSYIPLYDPLGLRPSPI